MVEMKKLLLVAVSAAVLSACSDAEDTEASYSDSEGAAVLQALDSQGNAVAQEELEKLVSAPMGQETWQALEAAHWVRDGDPDAERIVYTFTDANCPFCNELWHSARPWIEGGKVQLRHLMVGVIRADSAAKAAAILQAEDPEAALAYNIQNRDTGGIDPLDSVPPETSGDLDSNAELMRELGFGGTPGIVARSSDGSLVRHNGAARGSTLEELFGPL